jgi:ATP-dependent helicase Lhr and Lhr-like helicase
MDIDRGLSLVRRYFEARHWRPQAFQEDTWMAFLGGSNGLLHSDTGSGKTLAAWLGPVAEYLSEVEDQSEAPPPQVLWITPLRALASDTEATLRESAAELGLAWRVERRTSDTTQTVKARQKVSLPSALITTPESLSLLLSYPATYSQLADVRAVIVDEWHEFLSTKRGVQVELCLARLRSFAPRMRIWGLSATISNLEEAADALTGGLSSRPMSIVRGSVGHAYEIDTLIPEEIERFPWAGHLGLKMVQQVAEELDACSSALVFTNTRSQTELWYRSLLEIRPEWAGQIAIHHGSLHRTTRRWVEENINSGALRCVVCTSSLDLGVDFAPVERVFQVGSPKGVARILQRAGRSGHQPGRTSRITCVPTHAIELLEFAAVRVAAEERAIEPRIPRPKPLDLLIQHIVTTALGTGFEARELLEEVRSTRAYRDLTEDEFQWALRFAESGGETLAAYEDYQRITPFRGTYVGTTDYVARRHRMSVGTIVSDAEVTIKYLRGQKVGTVEESFVARLDKGDKFFFGGKTLEFVRMRDMVAYVKTASGSEGSVPRWAGGRIPLSSELALYFRRVLAEVERGEVRSPEVAALAPLLELQQRWSLVPRTNQVLIERAKSREGYHLFIYPFEGRQVHEGLAAVVALRLSRLRPITFTMAYNDYGLELLSSDEPPFDDEQVYDLFGTDSLIEDIEAGLNEVEMMRRHFREIARVAGLVFQGFPSRGKSQRQLQVSSGLLFDVFTRHDPQNRLLEQARDEVLAQQLETERLRGAMERIQRSELVVVDVPKLTPFAFPILVDRLREKVSSERLGDRVRRMQAQLENAASSNRVRRRS